MVSAVKFVELIILAEARMERKDWEFEEKQI